MLRYPISYIKHYIRFRTYVKCSFAGGVLLHARLSAGIFHAMMGCNRQTAGMRNLNILAAPLWKI